MSSFYNTERKYYQLVKLRNWVIETTVIPRLTSDPANDFFG